MLELDITALEMPVDNTVLVSCCKDNASETIITLFVLLNNIAYLLEFDISILSKLDKLVFTQELPLLSKLFISLIVAIISLLVDFFKRFPLIKKNWKFT